MRSKSGILLDCCGGTYCANEFHSDVPTKQSRRLGCWLKSFCSFGVWLHQRDTVGEGWAWPMGAGAMTFRGCLRAPPFSFFQVNFGGVSCITHRKVL